MSPDQFAALAEDVRYIRQKTDETNETLTEFRVSVEGRLSRVEERAGWIGAVGGVLASLLATIGFHLKGR